MSLTRAQAEKFDQLGKEITAINNDFKAVYAEALKRQTEAEIKIVGISKAVIACLKVTLDNKRYTTLEANIKLLSGYKANWNKALNDIKSAQFNFQSEQQKLESISKELNTTLAGVPGVEVLSNLITITTNEFLRVKNKINSENDQSISETITNTENCFNQIKKPAGVVDSYAGATNALSFKPAPQPAPQKQSVTPPQQQNIDSFRLTN